MTNRDRFILSTFKIEVTAPTSWEDDMGEEVWIELHDKILSSVELSVLCDLIRRQANGLQVEVHDS